MKINMFLLIIIFLFPYFIQSQTLTPKEMLADLNQLESIVNNYFRAKKLVEKRTQTNISNEINLLREKCNYILSDDEFVDLIRQSLNILCDKHATIATSDLIKTYISYFPNISNYGNVMLSDTINADVNYNKAINAVMAKMKCGIRVKYNNGKYYNTRAFINKGIFVRSGEQITAINGIPITNYVAQNTYKLYNLAWDEQNRNWYSELFWINNDVIKAGNFCLTISNKDIELNCDVAVERTEKLKEFKSSPLVTTLDSNILYIRLPAMRDFEWYINQITNQYSSNIKKIVIDIRGNSGGEDMVWRKIMSTLICNTVSVRTNISMNDNEAVRNILPLFNIDEPQIIFCDTILPASNSINYKGDIYILQDADTYSSASTFASLAFQMDNIVSIGQPISYIGGRGLTPLIFKLNNSEIIFRMPITVDLSGGSINPFMNKVEIEIPQDADTYFRTITENQYEIEYLEHKDKLIKYVKEQ